MTMEEVKLKDLTPDDKNFNKGTEFGTGLLEKSLRNFGAGRSILIDKNNRIIAGNKTAEQCGNIGLDDVLIVESDGKKLVAVKRTDIDIDTPEGREMALADNAVGMADLDFDIDAIQAELGMDKAEEWGIFDEAKNIPETEKLSGLEYNPLYYEPQDHPSLNLVDCVDMSKYDAKLRALDEYNLTDGQKEVLKIFAYRFIKIDFERVADYYAYCANDEEKKAIERLRLVLTDDGKDGFIEDDMLRILNIGKDEDE